MRKILLTIFSFLVVDISICGHLETAKCMSISCSEADREMQYFNPYDIGNCEVRDTSFSLPRIILENPLAFMEAITEIQMKNRIWSSSYNYPEKLLYGDSIASEICMRIARSSKKHPVFVVEEINIGECLYYHFHIKNCEDNAYTTYNLIDEKINISAKQITDTLQSLMNKWDVREMFIFGWEDKVPFIEIEMEEVGIVHCGRPTGDKQSGCIMRFSCDNDSVHVNMLKLYLWPFIFYDNLRKNEKIIIRK